MANLDIALLKLWNVEFSTQPQRFLHKNSGEDGYTIGGVYEKANPHDIDWLFIKNIIASCNGAITRASCMLYYDNEIQLQVKNVYMNKYWHKMHLDKIKDQKIANEIFLMGVVGGTKTAIRLAQKTLGITADGIIGNQTITALNNANPNEFDINYDDKEIEYFETLVSNKPQFKQFLKGWKNRAEYV